MAPYRLWSCSKVASCSCPGFAAPTDAGARLWVRSRRSAQARYAARTHQRRAASPPPPPRPPSPARLPSRELVALGGRAPPFFLVEPILAMVRYKEEALTESP